MSATSPQPAKNPIPIAVFFDVDGVLLDSLPQHLTFARDKATQYNVSASIPDIDTFRAMVAAGAVVSPMLNFFLALGFPPENARQSVKDYKLEFRLKYPTPAFPGIDAVLSKLSAAGYKIGLVTANLRGNIEPALGRSLRYFDPRLLFFLDSHDPARPKPWCLNEGAGILGLDPNQCIYIGDQPADIAAASEAGCQFLGVSYGWGITTKTPDIEIANTIGELAAILATRRMPMTDDRTSAPPTLKDSPLELSKLRFDYAWKFFSFHATQRTQMFNFMLLLVGILAASLTSTIDKGLVEPAMAVCVIGIIVASIFLKLDRRNRDLVRAAENVLTFLELNDIFTPKQLYTPPDAPEQSLGIFSRRTEVEAKDGKGFFARLWRGEHRILLPLFAGIVAVLFAAAAYWVFDNQVWIRARAPTSPPPANSTPSAAAALAPLAQLSAAQPANIGDLTAQLAAYHDFGAYDRDLWSVIKPAEDYLTQRAPQVKMPALVLDVDETALSNWPKLAANAFAYFPNGPCVMPPKGPCGEIAWEQLAHDEPIPPTLDIYNLARSKHIAVFFITGRDESLRAATEANLRAAGYATWDRLIMRPPNTTTHSAADYKAPARQQIEQEGFTILANIGDQLSDLQGGHAERSYLLPDPFYRIP
jgi:HAD superfamily hydrolase (TIGR01549 family)